MLPSNEVVKIFCSFSALLCIQWQRNKGKVVTDLFEELPLTFQAELSLETYRTMIERVHNQMMNMVTVDREIFAIKIFSLVA